MHDPFFDDDDFSKADPVERGCGEREPGGVYAESGLSRQGRPLETFLLDPPLPIPDGLDLVNKPQLWQRTLPTGEPALDEQGEPIVDLLIWVGAEHYPYCPDFIEEVRLHGASRRLNPNLDLSRLSRASRMILAHPRALNTRWQEQRPPQECGKRIAGHADRQAAATEARETIAAIRTGPCLFKLWEVIPQDAAQTIVPSENGDGDGMPLCLREIGSTMYSYRPTGEAADGLVPGLFAALPLTGFALIKFVDGSVNEKAKQKVVSGLEAHGSLALPFYEPDR